MRLIDFIIPEYNTKSELIERALHSINIQKNIDFNQIGIIIVSDGSKKPYKNSWFKQKFPKLNIDYYYKKENEGPGLTRQYGIDNSKAKFVSFLDSDDELYKNDSLCKVYDKLFYEDVNIMFTYFIEELNYNGKIVLYTHDPSKFATLHGLYVNREFLIKNNIRFSKEIRYQEDTYFAHVLLFGYGAMVLETPAYLWKYNDVSLVRKDKEINWNVKIIEDYIKAGELIYNKLEELDKENRHRQILTCIFGAYFILQSDDFKKDEERRKRNYESLIALYHRIKEKSYNRFTKEERREIFDSQYKTTLQSIKVTYELDFDEYLERNNLV